ncbi:MAG: hypothetical protein JNM43_05510 [Planctomycetaceae bacterium]|nr:hypothetical protein [Planctomycetaceae bacterium]
MDLSLTARVLATLLAMCMNGFLQSVPAPENAVDDLRESMRLQILSLNKKEVSGGVSQGFDFLEFADAHGLNRSRKALVSLLTDDAEHVRKVAADASAAWLRPGDLDLQMLERCLQDSDANVRSVAIRLWPVEGVPPEAVFRLARDPADLSNLSALREIPRFIQSGNMDAETVLLEMIESKDVDAASLAISLLKEVPTLVPRAEPGLRNALTRLEEGRPVMVAHFPPVTLPPVTAQTLRELGFADPATADSLRIYCEQQEKGFRQYSEMKLLETNGGDAADARLKLGKSGEPPFDEAAWVDAAFALALWQRDFEPLRNLLFLQTSMSPPDDLMWNDLHVLIPEVLNKAPVTLTRWEHGTRVCRSLLSTSERRRDSENWEALKAFPGASYVFHPEMLLYLSELPSESEKVRTSASPGILKMLATDGYTKTDLEFSLRILRLEHRCRAAGNESFEQFGELVVSNHYEREVELMLWSLINNTDVNRSFVRRTLPSESADGQVSRSREHILAWLKGE